MYYYMGGRARQNNQGGYREMKKCPMCHGEVYYIEPVLWDGIGGGPVDTCSFCEGKGKVSDKQFMLYVRAHKRDYNG